MIVVSTYRKQTNGGLTRTVYTDYKLFGIILLCRIKDSVYS